MADVKVEMTPAEQLVAKAKREFEVTYTDDDGNQHVAKLRKPAPLAQFRLAEMVGQSSSNLGYMAMVMPLLFLVSIDDDIAVFSTKRELEVLINRLGSEGCDAVARGVFENFGGQADPEQTKADIKN